MRSHPSITISRMAGAGGRTVASKLAEDLQAYAPRGRQWTVFDRNLIEKVLEDHHLSRRLAEYLPESSQPFRPPEFKELRGQNLSSTTMVEQTVETIWKLAEDGFVILVGRGANVITAGLDNMFHVRLVGSLEKRARRLEMVYDFDRATARQYLKTQDESKKRYLKEYFDRDIEDPLLYHLVVNTDGMTYEGAARVIADAVIHRFHLESTGG
ncbi:MAG TPA: cytidylate kinase-like family protein [Verrucomicrobiae bacterium]|nr:cytidylate kinase-like family protein [Verrucomicrobiae bacterium]